MTRHLPPNFVRTGPALGLIVWFTLSGCGPGLTALGTDRNTRAAGDDAATDAGAGDPAPAGEDGEATEIVDIEVSAVQPWYGSDAGGSRATISGTGFADGISVTFGGATAEVVSVTDTQIEVIVPENHDADWVDVQVIDGPRGDVLTAGFQYWRDATGLTGGFLTLERVKMIGGYWSDPVDPAAWATLQLFTPVDIAFRDLFTSAWEGCTHNYPGPNNLMQYSIDAESVELRSGNETWSLTPDASDPNVFTSGFRLASAVPATDRWGIGAFAANDFPDIHSPENVEGVATFNVTEPGLDRNQMPTVGRSFDVAWTGSGGDYVIILARHLTYDRQNNLVMRQIVACAVEDDGAFNVPRAIWPSWSETPDDYLEIQIGRVKEAGAELPHDHSTLSGVGAAWVLGAAFMQ